MGQKKLVPLYHQIYLTLRNELLSGSFRGAGDGPPQTLPSENELADRYAVSRVTIRQALKTLEAEGMVIRRHGVGTFPAVLPDKPHLPGEAGDVYDDLDALTRDYDQKILSYERIATPGFILRRSPDFGERCLHLSVLSKRDSRPIHLHRQYVPERLGHLLGKRRPRQVSLLLELKKHGITASTINLDLSATAADMDSAGHLEVPVGSPLIATTRTALDANAQPIEHFEAFTRPDQYVYRFQLSGIDVNSTFRQVFTK